MKRNGKRKGEGKRRLAICLVAVMLLMSAAGGLNGSGAAAKVKPALSKKKVTLSVGGKVVLKLKNWKGRVSWSSSQKSVATVSSKGAVRGKKKGKARITAKAGGKKYVCQVTVGSPSGYAAEILKLVNKERKKNGLKALVLDSKLCKAADKRASELNRLFDHSRPDGSSCFTVLKQYGISYGAAGENIAAGYTSAKEVVKGWMNSPGHRANILSKNFKALGVGHKKSGRHYWVQLFTDGKGSGSSSGSATKRTTRRPAASQRATARPDATAAVCPPAVSSSPSQPQSPGSDSVEGYAEQVLSLVNAERAKAGVGALVLDPALCQAATARAQEITGTFSHTRPDGSDCFTILGQFGISYRAVGENIAAGQRTPEAVMDSWMDSSGHRANILSASYRKLGVGCVQTGSGYRIYWTQLFTD